MLLARAPRIVIADLPPLETLTPEEAAELLGVQQSRRSAPSRTRGPGSGFFRAS
jgi:hypothetical protein